MHDHSAVSARFGGCEEAVGASRVTAHQSGNGQQGREVTNSPLPSHSLFATRPAFRYLESQDTPLAI